MKEHILSPDQVGISYEDVYYSTTDQVKIHSWFFPVQNPKGTILFLHGNAENISTHFQGVSWLNDEGYEILLVDYRGYGLSEGSPDVPEVFADVEGALKYLFRKNANRNIFVFGQSIGAAITIGALSASKYRSRVQGILLEGSFSSYRRITREKLASFFITWPLQYPLSWFMSDRYAPDRLIQKLKGVPLFFLHGTKDQIVLAHHSDILYAEAENPKMIWKIPEVGHINASGLIDYRKRILSFLKEHSNK